MASPISAKRDHWQHEDEVLPKGLDFTNQLRSGETISSVDSVTPDPTGPTISVQSVNAAALTNDEGGTVAIGKAALFTVSGVEADTSYDLTVKVTTSIGATRVGVLTIHGREK